MIYSVIAAVIGLLLITAGLKKRRTGHKRSSYIDCGIGIFLILLSAVNSFVISPYKIPSESMVPILNVGDFAIVKKFGFKGEKNNLHNKIIVFKDPRDNDTYVKRIIAITGDKVSWDGLDLKVNGQNQYIYTKNCNIKTSKSEAIYSFMSEDNIEGSWLVKTGIFAVGTNICKSMDSRSYGEIPLENVIGIVIGVCSDEGCKTTKEFISDKY